MKGLRIFFGGLFTRHIGTKFLSLLLSIIIILLVQQSLTSNRVIPEVRLEFTLAEELADQYVLLRNRIEFADLRVRGLHSVVEPKAKELIRDSRISVVVNERLFNRYRDGMNIPVGARLLADEALFGSEIEFVDLPGGMAVILDELVKKKLPVKLTPNQEARLTLDEDSTWLSAGPNKRRLDVTFSIQDVEIEGPKSSLSRANALYIDISDVKPWLEQYKSVEDEVTVQPAELIQGVNLKAGEIFEGHRPHLRVLSPRPMSLAEFERGLSIRFKISQQKVERSLRAKLIFVSDGNLDVSQYESLGNPVLQNELTQRSVDWKVRVPKSIAKDEELFGRLEVVLDFSGLQQEDELKVPVSLRIKGPLSDEDNRKIRAIELPGDQQNLQRKKN